MEAEERPRRRARRPGRLIADQRAALVLVDMEGYSVEEAATILGVRARHGEEPLRPRSGQALALLAHLAAGENGRRGGG